MGRFSGGAGSREMNQSRRPRVLRRAEYSGSARMSHGNRCASNRPATTPPQPGMRAYQAHTRAYQLQTHARKILTVESDPKANRRSASNFPGTFRLCL